MVNMSYGCVAVGWAMAYDDVKPDKGNKEEKVIALRIVAWLRENGQ